MRHTACMQMVQVPTLVTKQFLPSSLWLNCKHLATWDRKQAPNALYIWCVTILILIVDTWLECRRIIHFPILASYSIITVCSVPRPCKGAPWKVWFSSHHSGVEEETRERARQRSPCTVSDSTLCIVGMAHWTNDNFSTNSVQQVWAANKGRYWAGQHWQQDASG